MKSAPICRFASIPAPALQPRSQKWQDILSHPLTVTSLLASPDNRFRVRFPGTTTADRRWSTRAKRFHSTTQPRAGPLPCRKHRTGYIAACQSLLKLIYYLKRMAPPEAGNTYGSQGEQHSVLSRTVRGQSSHNSGYPSPGGMTGDWA